VGKKEGRDQKEKRQESRDKIVNSIRGDDRCVFRRSQALLALELSHDRKGKVPGRKRHCYGGTQSNPKRVHYPTSFAKRKGRTQLVLDERKGKEEQPGSGHAVA